MGILSVELGVRIVVVLVRLIFAVNLLHGRSSPHARTDRWACCDSARYPYPPAGILARLEGLSGQSPQFSACGEISGGGWVGVCLNRKVAANERGCSTSSSRFIARPETPFYQTLDGGRW